jgi:Flp pilus assembly protein TadG
MLLFAMAFVALIGVVALSIDAGYLLAERRQVQNAADAAALAAARSALDNQPYVSIAQSYAKSNAGTTAQVTTNRPPVSGAYAGNNNYIQVTITKPVTKFFVGAVYNGDWSVSATAVAGLEPRKFDAALLALNPDAGGISTGGSTTIEVEGGSIVSNYKISTSGSTRMVSDKLVVANDGIVESGSSVVKGDLGRMDHGPEIPDPL